MVVSNRNYVWTKFDKLKYMFNQVDRYLIAVTSKNMHKSQGWFDKDGAGPRYDFLVGSVFTNSSVFIFNYHTMIFFSFYD